MEKGWKRVPAGTFDGKRITFASTERVEACHEIAAEFMRTIFDFEPGDYAISDESDILDFMSFDEWDIDEVWSRIERNYGISKAGVGSECLVRIFEAIGAKRGTK